MDENNTNLIAVLGGVEMTAVKDDGSTETVKVRQLKLRQSQAYLTLAQANDEAGMIELFCDKPQNWADSLTPDSQQNLLETGEKLNRDFMLCSAARRVERREKLAPGAEEKLMQAVVAGVMKQIEPSLKALEASVPASAPRAAGPSTNSPSSHCPK